MTTSIRWDLIKRVVKEHKLMCAYSVMMLLLTPVDIFLIVDSLHAGTMINGILGLVSSVIVWAATAAVLYMTYRGYVLTERLTLVKQLVGRGD